MAQIPTLLLFQYENLARSFRLRAQVWFMKSEYWQLCCWFRQRPVDRASLVGVGVGTADTKGRGRARLMHRAALPLVWAALLRIVLRDPLKGINIPTGLQMPFPGRGPGSYISHVKKTLAVQIHEGFWLSFPVAHLPPTIQMLQQFTCMWFRCCKESRGLQSCRLYWYYYS